MLWLLEGRVHVHTHCLFRNRIHNPSLPRLFTVYSVRCALDAMHHDARQNDRLMAVATASEAVVPSWGDRTERLFLLSQSLSRLPSTIRYFAHLLLTVSKT